MSAGPNPLAGRRILVTRPAERGEALTVRLTAAGAEITYRPAIDFDLPADVGAADRAVRDLACFNRLVFTSPTGVRFFLERLRASGITTIPETVRIAVVGPGTARALQDAGYRPDLVPRQNDADGLGVELAVKGIQGEAVLWIRPEVAGPVLGRILEAAGARVTAAAFYRTVPHPECPAIAGDLATGRYHGILFTSPSTFSAVFNALEPDRVDGFRRLVLVAIGKVTAGAMEAAGCPPQAIARKPTADGIADAFEVAFGLAPLC